MGEPCNLALISIRAAATVGGERETRASGKHSVFVWARHFYLHTFMCLFACPRKFQMTPLSLKQIKSEQK